MLNIKKSFLASVAFLATGAASGLFAVDISSESMNAAAQAAIQADEDDSVPAEEKEVTTTIDVLIDGVVTSIEVTVQVVAGSVIVTPTNPSVAGFTSLSASVSGAGAQLTVTAATVATLTGGVENATVTPAADLAAPQVDNSSNNNSTDQSQTPEEQTDDGPTNDDALGNSDALGNADDGPSFDSSVDLGAVADSSGGAEDSGSSDPSAGASITTP